MLNKQNIFLIGAMGAGKTTIGKQLAQELGREFMDTDLVIESRTGVSLAWIFDVEGEQGFREREQKIIDELTQKSNIVLATGGGSVILAENRSNLSARGVVVYLKTTLEEQLARMEKDKKRPLLLGVDDKAETLKELASERNTLYEEIADFVFRTDESSVKVIVDKIIQHLRSPANTD
ncbi:MAG: shikimate kinase AroK [Legionellales bacterium]|nr:shikimate kinase AroK [Legionellales bacterium]|tara:strand:+ start:73 stop:606 length:534 start_codon:yes stop_codon:yes gene_type:complete